MSVSTPALRGDLVWASDTCLDWMKAKVIQAEPVLV